MIKDISVLLPVKNGKKYKGDFCVLSLKYIEIIGYFDVGSIKMYAFGVNVVVFVAIVDNSIVS
jgi:hypothetical protein